MGRVRVKVTLGLVPSHWWVKPDSVTSVNF